MLFGFGKSPRRARRYKLERLGQFAQSIVRVAYYQRELDKIAGGRTEKGHTIETTADIVPDEQNSRDKNAVRIDIRNKTVGYLAAGDARKYREWLRNEGYPDGVILECPALILGGWDRGRADRGSYNVRLDLPVQEIFWAEERDYLSFDGSDWAHPTS